MNVSKLSDQDLLAALKKHVSDVIAARQKFLQTKGAADSVRAAALTYVIRVDMDGSAPELMAELRRRVQAGTCSLSDRDIRNITQRVGDLMAQVQADAREVRI